MKRYNLLRTTNIAKHNTNSVRGSKNPWDPIQGFPYTPVEDHVEPKDEEIISISY